MLPDTYGCPVANRYGDLLDDDADPFEFINKVGLENNKKKQDKEKKDKQKKVSQKDRRVAYASEVKGPATVHNQQQKPALPESVSGRGNSGDVAIKRASLGERWANKEVYPQEFSISKPSYNADSDLRNRGGNRGRRGSRGGGGYVGNADNFNMRGKREYDRQSGTGLSPEEKRGGSGRWNWGSFEESVRNESMEISHNPVQPEEAQTRAEEDDQNRALEEDGDIMVHVAVEMTLDEWKTLQETSRPKAEFNIRKSENQIPSKAKVIHKSKHTEEGILEEVEEVGTFLRKSVNDITSLLDINFGSLGRPSRGGRGRGARGGPANRPERPKPILEREDGVAPNPDDPDDFPALSAGK